MMAAMRFRHELTYDAPPDQVFAMLADPAFRDEVCTAQGGTPSEITLDGAGAGMTVVVDQVQPAEGIPGFAKKFIGDEINVVQREEWTTEERADLHVTIPGKPGAVAGSITLAASGATTTETVDVEIKVNIPLVGGKIESLIADMLRKALRAEGEAGRDYLSR
jgi:uncharacterized protein YndB with AHSA1/START domain